MHDRQVLTADFWTPLAHDAAIDVRRGDGDDPLAGVVRLTGDTERTVDIIVGRHRWQREAIERAEAIGSEGLRVVQRADLILLKLYAGGLQDMWDVAQVLATDISGATASTVDERIAALPVQSRELWTRIRPS